MYIGAIAVLFLFVVMLLDRRSTSGKGNEGVYSIVAVLAGGRMARVLVGLENGEG